MAVLRRDERCRGGGGIVVVRHDDDDDDDGMMIVSLPLLPTFSPHAAIIAGLSSAIITSPVFTVGSPPARRGEGGGACQKTAGPRDDDVVGLECSFFSERGRFFFWGKNSLRL